MSETLNAPEIAPLEVDPRPPLLRDRSFWGMTATQFLGAFNDNLFKQLMLLLAVPVAGSTLVQFDQQGIATIVFGMPFVIFSGLAGYLSDRHSKTTIIVLAKMAEIVIMLLGVTAFLFFAPLGYRGLLVVLWLMGTHSAFFGPGKYGILPEMLRERDLPRANGLFLMTTFIAIIFGTALAGVFAELFVTDEQAKAGSPGKLWMACGVCVLIAVVGTLTSLMVRRMPPANPNLRFSLDSLLIPRETRALLRSDRPLTLAILASCVFWLASGVAIQTVNAFGKTQLNVGDMRTSLMTAIIGVGIALGAVVAGKLCHAGNDGRVVKLGAWGMVAGLLPLAVVIPGFGHLLGFGGSLPLLLFTGAAAGMFAIPLQVFIQTRPPHAQKGRIIAVLNQANFIAIVLAGVIYQAFSGLLHVLNLPPSCAFALMALFILPVALLYRLTPARRDPHAAIP